MWGTQALCGAWMQDEFLCSDTCLFFIVPLVMQRSSITPDGEMLFCFIVKDRLKDSSGFSVSYSLLLKCPGFHCLFSTPCRKVFSRLWVKDSGIALSATTGNSCFSLYSTYYLCQWRKNPTKFNYWDLKFFHLCVNHTKPPFQCKQLSSRIFHAFSSAHGEFFCLFQPGPQGMFWKLVCGKCFLCFI